MLEIYNNEQHIHREIKIKEYAWIKGKTERASIHRYHIFFSHQHTYIIGVEYTGSIIIIIWNKGKNIMKPFIWTTISHYIEDAHLYIKGSKPNFIIII